MVTRVVAEPSVSRRNPWFLTIRPSLGAEVLPVNTGLIQVYTFPLGLSAMPDLKGFSTVSVVPSTPPSSPLVAAAGAA